MSTEIEKFTLTKEQLQSLANDLTTGDKDYDSMQKKYTMSEILNHKQDCNDDGGGCDICTMRKNATDYAYRIAKGKLATNMAIKRSGVKL